MKIACLEASDIIALVAIFIAIMSTVFELRREWYTVCELLFQSMDSLFIEIKDLAKVPNNTNHISFQHCLNHRKNLLEHYANRFFFKREQINEARSILVYDIMNLPLHVEFEELINTGFKDEKETDKIFLSFMNEIKGYTAKASKALIN